MSKQNNLSGADLRGLDRRNLNLRGFSLRHTNLIGADLRGAQLPIGRWAEGARINGSTLFCKDNGGRAKIHYALGGSFIDDVIDRPSAPGPGVSGYYTGRTYAPYVWPVGTEWYTLSGKHNVPYDFAYCWDRWLAYGLPIHYKLPNGEPLTPYRVPEPASNRNKMQRLDDSGEWTDIEGEAYDDHQSAALRIIEMLRKNGKNVRMVGIDD